MTPAEVEALANRVLALECKADMPAANMEAEPLRPIAGEIVRRHHELAKLKGRSGIGQYWRDSGFRAIVSCLAAGWTQEDIYRLLPHLVRSNWFRTRGMSSMSPEVLRRMDASAAKQASAEPERPPTVDDAAEREKEATAARMRLEALFYAGASKEQ